MTKHEKFEVARVKLPKPFSDFYVQIEPKNEYFGGKQYHDMILKDDSCCNFLFGSTPSNDENELIEDAIRLGIQAVHDYIEEMFSDYYYPNKE